VCRAVKRSRPPLPSHALGARGTILTTGDVARLLRVHPKHVYRLLRQGLPGHRVGGEWRFFSEEVLGWSGRHESTGVAAAAHETDEADASDRAGGRGERVAVAPRTTAPPLVAANGDLAVERLLARARDRATGERTATACALGLVQGDRSASLALLRRGAVVAAGYHGESIPRTLGGNRLAFIHLVHRPIGLAVRRGLRVPPLRQLHERRFASRPTTAGVRASFDGALRIEGIDPQAVHARASLFASHGEVACAVARGEADVGLASAAWASRVGLDFLPLYREAYGFLVRATSLDDPRVAHLCEVAQSAAFRRDLAAFDGYDATGAGTLQFPAQGATSPYSLVPKPSNSLGE
jgi:putative molybdopterin biosynthesis protein